LIMNFHFRAMSQADAEAIARWHYPEPFSFYDVAADPDGLAELLDSTLRGGEYFAVDDGSGTLVGFFQCKRPHGETLEIGLGLHPDWTGRGLGVAFLNAGLEHARRRFAPKRFTLSVASFNRRAITVYSEAASRPCACSRTRRTVASGSSSRCSARPAGTCPRAEHGPGGGCAAGVRTGSADTLDRWLGTRPSIRS